MVEKKPSRRRLAAPRSRGDHSQPTPPAVASADAEQEWQALLVAQDDDTMIADIVAELMERVMDACLQAFVARECVPYTMRWARDIILRSVLYCFPVRDEGDTDPGIDTEDEEPQPCPMDSCAHGCTPVRPSRSEVSSASVGAQESPMVAKAGGPLVQHPCPSQVPTATTTIPAPEPSRSEDNAITPRPPKGQGPRSQPLAPRLRPPCPAGLPAPCPPRGVSKTPAHLKKGWHLPQSLHRDVEELRSRVAPLPPSRASLNPTRPEVPSRILGVTHRGAGTHSGVPRLRSSCWPQRWIEPCVEVLQVGMEAKVPACAQGTRGRSRRAGGVQGTQPQPSPALQLPRPLPRALGSALAPGVTISWGDSTTRELCVPVPGQEEEDTRDLRPIQPNVPIPAIAAGDLTGGAALTLWPGACSPGEIPDPSTHDSSSPAACFHLPLHPARATSGTGLCCSTPQHRLVPPSPRRSPMAIASPRPQALAPEPRLEANPRKLPGLPGMARGSRHL